MTIAVPMTDFRLGVQQTGIDALGLLYLLAHPSGLKLENSDPANVVAYMDSDAARRIRDGLAEMRDSEPGKYEDGMYTAIPLLDALLEAADKASALIRRESKAKWN